ncbi:Steroid 17-alpha-hydroxylase/17,20 lyase [Penicillium chrysogenum]|uniref:Pc16g00400 protein n=2 Tax=Penicillium chrysogenum species complex TaxID=254878 RepID=B6H6V2_PENRW|nr:Steroid 17-alpha-hydroxylase/17,20 lyase [Penicillium chrysogenum]CAP92710.1 Pc16g00400 [Penicillium rubens Wisconsin 54-1255]
MALLYISTVAALALVLLFLRAVLNSWRIQRKLPPGPPGLPLIGNIHQIPAVRAHQKFTEWAKVYGGLYSFRIGPATAAVITDRGLVKELLDKRSALYSSRPVSYVGQNLITGGDHLLVMDNNEMWRLFRKTVHQHFKASMCEKEHVKLLEAEHTQMMRDFLLYPEKHMLHTKRTTNSIIMSLLYGIRTPSWDTPHMQELYEIMEQWSKVMETGATPPVDIFPWLKWIPQRWLGNWVDRSVEVGSGMKALYGSFRRRAIEARRQAEQSSQSRARTFIDHVLDLQEKASLTDNQVDFLGGVMMEGGSDTGSTMLLVMIQALVQHPEVQERARAELDAVCGEDRSPTWADFSRLPYINMVVKETMRWRPVTPLSFPHALNQDDWVNGYLLPKGTTVFLNVWGLHHDESVFPNPERFDPSHYEGRHNLASDYAASPDYMQRDHFIYGAGRRLCPGIHLSERSMFIGAAKLLWGFQFESEMDESGRPVAIDTDPITGYTEGFLVCPRAYKCKVSPRSAARAETIMREFAQAEFEVLCQYATP